MQACCYRAPSYVLLICLQAGLCENSWTVPVVCSGRDVLVVVRGLAWLVGRQEVWQAMAWPKTWSVQTLVADSQSHAHPSLTIVSSTGDNLLRAARLLLLALLRQVVHPGDR